MPTWKQANKISDTDIVTNKIKLVSDNGVPSDMNNEALLAESYMFNSIYLLSNHSSHFSQPITHHISHPNFTPTNELQPDPTYIFDDFLVTQELNSSQNNPLCSANLAIHLFNLSPRTSMVQRRTLG